MNKYKFIINPVPLRKKHMILLLDLKKKLEMSKKFCSFEHTQKEVSAQKIAKRAVDEGFTVIVACGGDGTIMEAINGIYGSKAILGILPFGTSNDFAKHLGIENVLVASEKIFSKKTKSISLGRVDFYNKSRKTMLFNSTSGIGFDASMLMLNRKTYFLKLKNILGAAIYPIAAFFLVFSYKSFDAEVKINNNKTKMDLFMLNANFVRAMSGMKVTPYADPEKGSFDIFIVKQSGILKKIFGFIWYAFTSKKVPFDSVIYLHKGIRNFSVTSKENMPVQLNGDFIGYTPVKFKVIPKCIKILC